jgi:hypothetical protein
VNILFVIDRDPTFVSLFYQGTMLKKSFGLLFFLRKPKNYKSGPIPIYLKLTVDGLSKELSAKRKRLVADWNAASGRLTGKKESVKELNYYLDSLEQKVYQALS